GRAGGGRGGGGAAGRRPGIGVGLVGIVHVRGPVGAPRHLPAGYPPPRRMTAPPCPPPEQIAAQPRPPPRRRSSSTRLPRIRAPEAPIGCPRATAPPFTLTRSSSMPSIRIEFSVTEANASLISHRSMSPGCRPALSKAFFAALPGVVANQAKSLAL